MTETLPNWRKGCTPHRDIREGAWPLQATDEPEQVE